MLVLPAGFNCLCANLCAFGDQERPNLTRFQDGFRRAKKQKNPKNRGIPAIFGLSLSYARQDSNLRPTD